MDVKKDNAVNVGVNNEVTENRYKKEYLIFFCLCIIWKHIINNTKIHSLRITFEKW